MDLCNKLLCFLHFKSEGATFSHSEPWASRVTLGMERHRVAAAMKRNVAVLLSHGRVSRFGCSITASESEHNCGVDREHGGKHIWDI